MIGFVVIGAIAGIGLAALQLPMFTLALASAFLFAATAAMLMPDHGFGLAAITAFYVLVSLQAGYVLTVILANKRSAQR